MLSFLALIEAKNFPPKFIERKKITKKRKQKEKNLRKKEKEKDIQLKLIKKNIIVK